MCKVPGQNSDADRFSLRFQATELEARRVLSEFAEFLETLCLRPAKAVDIEIAVAEAINNVVEHAYAKQENGEIRISLHIATDSLSIALMDQGAPLPDERLPQGKPADLSGPLGTLPEGGFGWFLIRELARNVSYSRNLGHNRLKLTFDL
ncbi:ATP-binding protein [Primorskyibacter sp. S87]|uniref:ATP-binding protein n=1 Tax=Primorskyibacter sp. S87 TaxID=3415126 RepID=UPI003C7A0C07